MARFQNDYDLFFCILLKVHEQELFLFVIKKVQSCRKNSLPFAFALSLPTIAYL